MTQEALKLALEALNDLAAWNDGEVGGHMDEPYAAGTSRKAITSIKEALQEHAMREVQRLGQEIEQEPLEYWNAVEGWVKIDEVREHFDSVGCGTIYKTAGDGRVPLCLAQPEQEPVRVPWSQALESVWAEKDDEVNTPPQRTWVGAGDLEDSNSYLDIPPQRKPLTDKAITQVINRMPKKMKGFMVDWDLYIFTRAIEAAHNIKGDA